MDSLLSNGYYFWGGLALLLLLAEAVTFTSVALVFSAAASVVFLSLLLTGMPASMAGQFLLFAFCGVGLYFPIRRLQKNSTTQTTTGDVAASLAEAPNGVVSSVVADGRSGRVILAHAFLGSKEWMFEADTPVILGATITITGVRGNIITVQVNALK
ncbi:MAG: hypothetical protein Q9M31_07770 [Mariprofundus sp.]|nr:hypothetical protein [Mariprofundus sp.]